MSKDMPKTPNWIYVVIASVALNGLLAGLLISKATQPKPEIVTLERSQSEASQPIRHRKRRLHPPIYDNPRSLITHLEPKRRREVMAKAMKQVKKRGLQTPRELLMALHNSHKHTQQLLQVETLDEQALQASLKENRALKEKLALQGDELILEILRQLTLEERKGALQSLQQGKRRRLKPGLKHKRDQHREN